MAIDQIQPDNYTSLYFIIIFFLASPTLAKVLGLGHEILALGETVNSQAQLIILQVRKLSRPKTRLRQSRQEGCRI